MCIVLFKKLKYESFLAKNENIDADEYGVPTQYGLYFAMGLSLFMEVIKFHQIISELKSAFPGCDVQFLPCLPN